MKKLFLILFIFITAFTTSCIFNSDDDEKEADNGIEFSAENYLPLKVGATWTYKSIGTEDTEEYTTTIVGTTIKNNKTYFVMFEDDTQDSIYVRIENNILYEILPFEESEAKAVSKRTGILSTTKTSLPEQFPSEEVPFFDFNKEPGQTWEIFSYSDSGEGYSYTFSMNGKLLSTEKVTVPAGAFDNCAKFEVTILSQYSYNVEGVSESHEWRNTMTFWLAPGVALVKIIEESREDNKEIDSSTDELISYSIPD